jgi:hypothetical protein
VLIEQVETLTNAYNYIIPMILSVYGYIYEFLFLFLPQNCINSNFLSMQIWQNYTCTDSGASSCKYNYRTINPIIYNQLVMAANASYALYHYTPLLLSLQDCKFVRDTFSSITTQYCPNLERNLRLVCAGLALISAGVLLCLVLWVFYANRPRRVDEFVP